MIMDRARAVNDRYTSKIEQQCELSQKRSSLLKRGSVGERFRLPLVTGDIPRVDGHVGAKVRSFAPLPPVTLDELVPPDYFYRHLERSLDLSFARKLVRDRYAEAGRPAIDPVVFFKRSRPTPRSLPSSFVSPSKPTSPHRKRPSSRSPMSSRSSSSG